MWRCTAAVVVVVVVVVLSPCCHHVMLQALQDMADRVRDDHAQVHGPVRAAAAAPTSQGRAAPVPQHGPAAGAGIP